MGTRNKPWLGRVSAHFDGALQRVFSHSDLAALLERNGKVWDTPSSLTVSRLIAVLSDEADLRKVEIRPEARSGAVKTRYTWGSVSAYAIGLALARGSYLSHASAIYLHALTDQVPKTIYVNKEQSPKPAGGSDLSQANINRAFKRPVRKSTYTFTYGQSRFVLLSGKNTRRLEVAPVITPGGEVVDTTKLERTLIDVVVRPAYAGGLVEVLAAYASAVPRLSVGTLLATLRKLDYTYPYHQSIGFLLERVGLPEAQLERIEALGVNRDFFLDYQLADPAYDERWRLFYPQGL